MPQTCPKATGKSNESVNNESVETVNECATSSNNNQSQSDFYTILGVSEDASYAEIKKKWLKLSLLYHPDKTGGDNEKFRQINLAYKVLSNPENRKKYNDSLAKTFDQLKEDTRDVEYHVNKEYLDEEGVGFNRDKFMQEFEKQRDMFGKELPLGEIKPVTEREAEEMPKVDNRSLEDLMAVREAELSGFKNNQRSELFDPRSNPEEFNFIFNQYQKLNRGRTDLEEVTSPDGPLAAIDGGSSAGCFADLDRVTECDMVNVDMVSRLTRTLRDHIIPAMSNTGEKQELEIAEKQEQIERTNELLKRLQRDRDEMNQAMEECKFEYQVLNDDTSKLYQPAIDGEDVTINNGGAMSLSDALAQDDMKK